MNLLAQTTFAPAALEPRATPMEAFSGLRTLTAVQSPRVAIKVKGRILFLNLSDVAAVHAEGNYVSLEGETGSYLLREAISEVAQKLEPYGFIRIHRSVLVNTLFVEEIRPCSTGEYDLQVKGGKRYTVTRTYKKNLKALAEFWIGASGLFPA